MLTRRAFTILAASLALTAGCGGDDRPAPSHATGATERAAESSTGESAEKEKGRSSPQAGAYYQLATTSGLVRSAAAPRAVGTGGSISGPEHTRLEAARLRLLALHGAGRQLNVLRRRLLPSLERLRRVTPGQAPSRRLARSALLATDAVNAGLRRYARSHPDVGALVPD